MTLEAEEFLSRNSTEFIYKETPEEFLFAMVRKQDRLRSEIATNLRKIEKAPLKQREELQARNQEIKGQASAMVKKGKDAVADIEKLLTIPHSRDFLTTLSRYGPHFRQMSQI